ncbi:universal stress protein [Acidiferrimicrobium sp. IK]|uniref:universal stress protein n=1 Tax=Acidiferrimicrobium sp. IK TaxID=2871700 RepID=UPI0021CB2FD5|nr:universal stress protein [Acidiferrimicrobium sp. IK]MCU4182877.1 universal stress protein [Acidiferrimicrobium sp. IK]
MTLKMERILVAVDGSANGQRALDWGILLARQFGAEVVAVHAVGLLTHLGGGAPMPSQGHRDEIRKAFETEWCQSLAEAGVPHRTVLADGAPVPVILGTAENEEVDVIVIGSRGVGGFPELLLGSTSHQVAEHTHRPVLIVPPTS